MGKPLKYTKGKQILDFNQLLDWIKAGHWIYLRDKPLHYSMILNMSVGTVKVLLASNQIWEAKEREAKERENNGK